MRLDAVRPTVGEPDLYRLEAEALRAMPASVVGKLTPRWR
jgi:hypothetical protein